MNVAEMRRLLEERRECDVEYDRPDLTKENLHDDFQRLFIEIFLDHVRKHLLCARTTQPVPPLRLMLLGTAGTGKSTTVQTLLQEIKRVLVVAGYEGDFVRVAAPTGCAAFNLRFGATTLHRLFRILNPYRWHELQENSTVLAAFQEKMKALRLVILDEISMIGKQMMGKISSRCRQGRATSANPNEDVLGNLSVAAVGDPAQCPPIRDTPFYDSNLHKDTGKEPDAERVKLANSGHLAYDSFSDVIILQTCHRIRQKDDTNDPEAVAYNERGQRFLKIMTRLRDCLWNEEDYYWLCKRKLGQLSFAEKSAFADAPVIMEFRKERDDEDPNASCESYNRNLLFSLAKDQDLPVARFTAAYDGVTCEEGSKYADDVFRGLSHMLELAEEAPILLTENMWVQAGLMNGTRGVIKAIIYRHGGRPDHTDPNARVPSMLLVECPGFVGDSFFDLKQYPERAKWVPIFPRAVPAETEMQVTRTQLSVVLAWALTPWKAQGMSLEKVVVKLGAAASKPGVAFVALTRARHPDGLALDDDFPVFSTFQKQKKHRTFELRQAFERRARATFSRTIRKYMRDASIYKSSKVWSEEESRVAGTLLDFVHTHVDIPDDDIVEAYLRSDEADGDKKHRASHDTLSHVWTRLTQDFPHMFAIAAARNSLHELDLHGHKAAAETHRPRIAFLVFDAWKTAISEVEDFVADEHMSPGTMSLALNILKSFSTLKSDQARLGNAYWMFQPEKNKLRMQSILKEAETVLLPVFSGKAQAWAMCEFKQMASSTKCIIHHWHKHKREVLHQLEQDIATHLHVHDMKYHVYQMKVPHTHMIVLNVMLQRFLLAQVRVEGGAGNACDAVFSEGHQALRHSFEKLAFAVERHAETDLRRIVKQDETVQNELKGLLGLAARLTHTFEECGKPEACTSVTTETAVAANLIRSMQDSKRREVPRGMPLLKRRRVNLHSQAIEKPASTDSDERKSSRVALTPVADSRSDTVADTAITVEPVLREARPQVAVPDEDCDHGADGSDDEVIMETKPDADRAAKRKSIADAAARRADIQNERGIGDIRKLAQKRQEMQRHDVSGASSLFGAERSLELRERLLTMRAKRCRLDVSSDANMSTSLPAANVNAMRQIGPIIPASEYLQHFARTHLSGEDNHVCSIITVETGGGGDCLFHSVAAVLVSMMERDPDARRHVLTKMPEAVTDLAHKTRAVEALRELSASQFDDDEQWPAEAFFDYMVNAATSEQLGAFPDAWSPVALLRSHGFECVVGCESVLAFGPDPSINIGDAAMRIARTDARHGAGHRLEEIVHVPNGVHLLMNMRNQVKRELMRTGNVHWGDQRDVNNLSEALDVGILMFCDRLQDEGRQCLYNIGSKRENFSYWIALWWLEPVHFRCAQLAFTSAETVARNDDFTCFWSDAELPDAIRQHYRACNRLAS